MINLSFFIIEDVAEVDGYYITGDSIFALIISGNDILHNPMGEEIYGKVLLCLDSDINELYIALKNDRIIKLENYSMQKVKSIVDFYGATKELESLALIESLISL